MYSEGDMLAETEKLRLDLEEMRRIKVDCFKMCFRIKVRDALGWATNDQQGISLFEPAYVVSFVITN